MARLKATAQDLQMLRMGLCPNCGAQVKPGMAACASCKIEFGDAASQIAGPKPAAAAAPPRTNPGDVPTEPSVTPLPRAPAPGGVRGTIDIDELERGRAACTV